MKSIIKRTTIRKYTEQNVSDDMLHQLLEIAERTPTMGNLQLYSVVITRSAEGKAALAPAHFNQPMVVSAPVVLTICADFHRTTAWANQRNASPGYDNFLSFLNAATDALLYTQTFCNLAEEKGLGTCFLGTTLYNAQSIIDTLHLPQLVFPVATITLGWPAEQPALTDRLPLRSIVHTETFEDYTAEKINDFYKEKELLPENQHFVDINHKETLAQVFTDLRYTKNDNVAMSKHLIEALRRQGFIE
ncbi:nitroreductase family protein [Prevotella sp. A2931]|uniref:Nitroreductase family protein n=1 Tax=Prevotella illustrans TaxID=2800387 RepID=A0ABS3M4X9_9BACT|nr:MULTISPECIES: nitroreductase family protein [Prevotella]MBO1363151.1 nitroreductase family protein [Prevotella illustrans]PTL26029.1 NADPH-dependent oxidoreductase [Prevotella sp. oral taxon 820]